MSLVYASGLDRYAPLSREEEMEIALRYKEDKNERDAQKLITSNLRYVVKVANKISIQHRDVDVSELIQEGNLGLMAALENFEPEKGFKLITYANQWIRVYIQRFISKNNNISSGATRHKHNQFFTSNLEGVEILDDIDVDSYEENNRNALEYKCCIEDKLAEKNWIKSVHEITDTLKSRDKYILYNRIMSDAPMKQKEVASHLSLSNERVRQLEKGIKKRLKEKFESNPDVMEYWEDNNKPSKVKIKYSGKRIGRPARKFDYEMAEELLKKEPYKTVAKKMGVSHSYLYTLMKKVK